MAHRLSESDVSPAIARKIAARASRADEAVVVGTRAGVIEWANAAWSRVTGYAVDDAVDKPIGWLLDAADIDASVVDFVQRHFLGGRRCEVELPVNTPDGRHLWIHLDVEPFRDEQGEVADFVAVATDITARRMGELALEERIARALAESAEDPDASAPRLAARDLVDRRATPRSLDAATLESLVALARVAETAALAEQRYSRITPAEALSTARDLALRGLNGFSERADARPGELEAVSPDDLVASLCARVAPQLPCTLALDVVLAAPAAPVQVDRAALDALLFDLVLDGARAVGDEWGTLSITTGSVEAGRALPSAVHPSIDRFSLTLGEPRLYIELHDTAPSLSRDALACVHAASGPLPRDSRSLGLTLARVRADALGATLRVHSLPGVGTRVLIYLPASALG